MNNKLWNRNFTLLFQGQLVSSIGMFATSIAIGFLLLRLTGSVKIMTTVMAVQNISYLFFLIFGGYYADRLHKKYVLSFSDFIRGLTVLVAAYFAFSGQITVWMLFLVVIILGAGSGFFYPSSKALLPEIVSRKNLKKSNSYINISTQVGNVGGNSLGGLLFQLLGAPLLFLIDGLTYLFSGVSELFLKTKHLKPTKSTILKDLPVGFSYLKKKLGLLHLTIFAGISNFFNMAGFVLWLPVFNLEFSPMYYGFFRAFLVLGIVIGSLIAGKNKSKNKFSIFSKLVILWPLILALPTLSHSFIIMSLFVFIGGVGNGFVNVFFISAIQANTPKNFLGKIMSFTSIILGITMPLGMILSGFLSDFLPLRLLIFLGYLISSISFIPFLHSKALQKVINFKE